MEASWLKFFLIASVWCSSEILCYNVHRTDNENGQANNGNIDYYSDYATRKFLEDLQQRSRDQTNMFTQFAQFEPQEPKSPPPVNNDSTPLDSWSVVWYIASFGGLIIFFLIVSCSEWCCRRAIRNNNQPCNANTAVPSTPAVPDTPPPSYDQFAPPSYESICLGRRERGCEKSEYDIYVVPVHALGTIMENRETEDAPPSYISASTGRTPTRFESNQQSRVT